MARVLVTGGTGVLGSYLVPRLVAAGHDTVVLSRRASPPVPDGATSARGDVLTGDGVAEAVAGVDTIVHAATSPRRGARRTEVEGTGHVADAARRAGAHVIYVSIVGVDKHRFPYYRAKHEAERVVEASGARWTVLRATQFHELIDQFLSLPLFPVTKHMAFQVVDAGDVSDCLVELVGGGPQGMAPPFGGPDIVPIRELAAVRQRVTGRRAQLVRVPAVGPLRDFDRGVHLCPDRRQGRVTWEQWLMAHR